MTDCPICGAVRAVDGDGYCTCCGKTVRPRCPFCQDPDPHHVGDDEYACRACKRPFVWFLSTEDYVTAITASRPAMLVGELLRGPQVVPLTPPHRVQPCDRGAIGSVQTCPQVSARGQE